MGQPSALISLGRSSAAEAPRKRRPGAFRPDIQGLRAIAVGLVVATHLFGWPTGGFVGVDVFFVISGFLITGLLMRELERTGGISMRNFYARRMRRIFPMSAIVLVCTVVAGFALFAASRADTTLVDAIWAFLFVENWHLVLNGADYFHATDAISPVQQYWSLSVEEQFYVVWPLLMLGLGAAAMARRRRRGAHEATAGMSGRLRAALGTAIGLIVLASFAWAIIRSGSHHTEAYFSTFTRIWELGLGAVLAIVVGLGGAAWGGPKARGSLLGLGLALIAGSALLLNEASRFPGPWAIVPVAGAVLALAFGSAARGPAAALLGTRAFQYTGQISYSLYLWHFPVIIFVFALFDRSPASIAAALALAVGLSAFSNYFVEEPVRHSNWLSGRKANKRTAAPHQDEARRGAPRWLRATVLTAAGAVVLAVAVTSIYPRFAHPSLSVAAPASLTDLAPAAAASPGAVEVGAEPGTASGAAVQPAAATASVDALATLHSAVVQSVNAAEWPQFDLPQDWRDYGVVTHVPACAKGVANSTECDFRNPGADKDMVVFGDSQVLAWLPGLLDAAAKAGYNVHSFSMPGCSVADVPVTLIYTDQPYPECAEYRHMAIAYVQAHRPDLTLGTSIWAWQGLREDRREDAEGAQNWADGTTVTLSAFASGSKRVVLMDSPPPGNSVGDCQTAMSVPSDCVAQLDENYQLASELNGRGLEAAKASTGKDFRHVVVTDWFCAPDAGCPSFVANQAVYSDGAHIAPGYSKFLSPLLLQQIFS